MQGLSSSLTDNCPSMAGVGLVADILPELPLPSPHLTSLESMIMGKGDSAMKPDTRRVLNNCDPGLCAQIDKTLKCVDTGFLKLKVAPPNQDYRPDITSPVLIKTLLKNGFPQPRVKLKKIDMTQFGGPHPSPTHSTHASPSHTVPSSFPSPHLPSSDINTSFYSTTQASVSESSTKGRTGKKSSEKKKRKVSLSKKSKSGMVVSIRRKLLKPITGPEEKKRSSKKKALASSSDSDADFKLPVSISRSILSSAKLAKRKSSSILPSPLANNVRSYDFERNITEAKRLEFDREERMEEFTLAPEVQDQAVPEGIVKKKKKKKHRHFKLDHAHKAHIDRYVRLLEGILDQYDQDCLLNRQNMSQLLSETAQLKQLKLLHQVSTGLLVKIIGLMDSHVLDTASLLLNEPTDDIDIKKWREMARERILRSLDAGLVILHITTSPNMPDHVHLEESIDLLISHTKYHLENNIYPEFDPVYRAESKETGSNAKQKRRYTSNVNKDIVSMYNRLVEVMDTLALLVDKQSLTDITILKLSSLGVLPFFVENISNLQLSSLKLVRTIFSRYEKHRDLIFDDVFSSLARLPTTKKNLRSFRLSNGQCVQMLTALILQLLQCTVLPYYEQDNAKEDDNNQSKVSLDVAVINSYELSMRTGSNFLSTFMRKCCSAKDEDDFRPLFDNFVQDLLATLSLPEWPASESLLTQLGVLLVRTFSNRSNEQQLRLTSLEHLGTIAARLRKDAVTSVKETHEQLVDILSEVMEKKLDSTSPLPSPAELQRMDAFSENARHLQKALIAFLSHHSSVDSSYTFAKNFYLGQWLRDSHLELEKSLKKCSSPSRDGLDVLLSDDEETGGRDRTSLNPSVELVQQAELTKEFLLALSKPMASTVMSPLASILDDKRAVLVTQYLASGRALSNSFDVYLQKLLRVLGDSAVHVRTRAMKTMSMIVAADPTILSRTEVQRAVHYKFSDTSTLMREAAVDLIGRFILIQPDLTATYYEMLVNRIMDTGVSVRRRVIKILKDVCLNQPEFDKITDICVNMIRRINDEEGIKQVVTGVFHQLWFTKPHTDTQQQITQRILHITEVVATSINEQECFERLLEQLLKDGGDKESGGGGSVPEVCQLMVDNLMQRVLYLDESADQQKSSKQLVNCLRTLYIFSKSRPSFLIQHARTLHPYLSTKCVSQDDGLIVTFVARILEKAVPLMERPSQSFLVSLEEDLIKLIMKAGPLIVQSCIECLAEVVTKVTKNYPLVIECYLKFFNYLEKFHAMYLQDPNSSIVYKPSATRSAFTVGLFCKHFNFDKILPESKDQQLMSKKVYSRLLSLCGHSDEEIQIRSLVGFGNFCINYPEFMLEEEAKLVYSLWLDKEAPLKLKLQVIKNLQIYLAAVESTLKNADTSSEQEENLMELGDRHSSVSSNIAQLYLPYILDSYSTTETKIRLSVVQCILMILRQGLVHPGQCIPHLIAMSTDPEQEIRSKADCQLSEYSLQFGGFIQTQLVTGLKKAYQFQQLVAEYVPRGCTDPPTAATPPSSLLSHMYTLVRSSRPQRRAFLKAVLKPFEDFDQTPLGMLLFLADNLSSFPYSVIEEPLFVIHHIDMTLSVTGASVLQSFREALGQSGAAAADDEDDDLERLSQETKSSNLDQLNECCLLGLGCVLLLVLKQYVKQLYNLSDKKCQEYSPSNSNKMWDKAVSRRQGSGYNPKEVVEEVQRRLQGSKKTRSKDDCIKLYVQFKKLMNRLDPFEGEEEDDEGGGVFDGSLLHSSVPPVQGGGAANENNVDEGNKSLLVVPTSSRKKSRSRASSVCSSTSSVNSKGKRRKKRKNSSDEESHGKKGGVSNKPTAKRKRYIISDSEDSDV